MRKMLWNISQWIKTIANSTPACVSSQNQRLKVPPANRAAPMAVNAAKPAIPRNGLGKPKASAWGVIITEPQLRIGLILQLGTKAGSFKIATFSTARTKAAKKPVSPPTSKSQGKTLLSARLRLLIGMIIYDFGALG